MGGKGAERGSVAEEKPRPSGRRTGLSHTCLTLDYSRKARPSFRTENNSGRGDWFQEKFRRGQLIR
jgi:hypothetical protein